MARITITLRAEERDALHRLAETERRDPRAQAALLIRHELERRGLLPTIDHDCREDREQEMLHE